MADLEARDVTMEGDYNESEDEDFEADDAAEDDGSTSEDAETLPYQSVRPAKRRKALAKSKPEVLPDLELDSGDEATIARAKRKVKAIEEDGDDKEQGWRAKTRAMREKEKEEKKKAKLASAKGSTVDVDKLWAEMNKPGSTAGHAVDLRPGGMDKQQENIEASSKGNTASSVPIEEEMVTIKRTYKFAGQMKTDVKAVPKSSAEGRLWLAQQEAQGKKDAAKAATSGSLQPVRRPLRRISRFDPNFNNLEAFKKTWSTAPSSNKELKGPKLNVVEKSKMDWAAHVDTEGLKDELDLAAKAKGGYLNRMDFLNEVEAKREEEAKRARLKG